MANYLVIVESPTKVKSITKFLGSSYKVMASNGHVQDLPKSSLGVDVENDFEPKYITIRGKGELISKLKKAAAKADKIYLATDPDREGEAISWHLTHALKLPENKTRRVTFNEITKDVVKESMKNAREIDMNLVDAQQARRVLDRVVGYSISPILWKKVKRGLSAGRVQSVALRIIAEREAEIEAFVPEEYWSLDVTLAVEGEKKPLEAHYTGKLSNENKVNSLLADLQDQEFKVTEVKRTKRSKKAPLPFTTSTMQQDANKALNFTAIKTMRVAQQLYEGVEIKGQGTVGLITYLRTDSTRVSDNADVAARAYIAENFGKDAVGSKRGSAGSARRIQDAHEAIRPTDVNRTPAVVKPYLSNEQFRLYQLIWKRFVASRMADAVYENVAVKLKAGKHSFSSTAAKLVEKGFQAVYTEDSEKNSGDNRLLGNIDETTKLSDPSFAKEQHFTQPPARYTESSLIKSMEELGVGRPSTYAPTIGTILARHYVNKEGKNLFLTELGEVVDSIMCKSFSRIADVNFTAQMESKLDQVEEGTLEWKEIIREFYPDFEEELHRAEEELEKVTIRDEESDEVCELCGRTMVIKYGAHGKFLACPGFPECRNTKPYLEKIGVKCPKCGGEIVIRRTRKGRRYYGCEHNPDCDYMSWKKPEQDSKA